MSARTPDEFGGRGRRAGLWGWLGRGAQATADALPVRIDSHAYARSSTAPARLLGFDQALLWVTAAILAWGLVMVYSASIALPDNPRFANYSNTYFFTRHLTSISIGLLVGCLAFQIRMETWERWAPWLFVATLLLLILVLIPGIGLNVNGARRWISLKVMNFQPSELGKLAVVLYAANYMVRKMDVKENFIRAVAPMGVAIVVVGLLLLAEPDMGAFLVIAVIAMGILFLGGVNARMFFLIELLCVGAFALMVFSSDWRRDRIFAYLNPWDERHVLGRGYQLSHSLIAFGRGEWFGQGLGNSVEKLSWLPEAHTDFLMAVLGEEFGLVGVIVLIGLFLWLTRRIMSIGRQAIALDRVFSGLVAQGIGVWMGFQAFINMGVNLGALPTKGLTLPLMSYGGSAILMNLVALAIVLRVDYENRALMMQGKGGRTR